jgi:2-polyprenyl-3-methyl-5-hydroxy-6-metoxy-1,4-benzoquinol methylase
MAASSASNRRPTPERIFATLNAHQQTAALKAAVELDVFTTIDEGYNRVEQIAEKVNAAERGVRILCDYLTVFEFLKKEDGRYGLSADAALFLSRRSPAYMGTIVEFLTNPQHFENIAQLTEAVRKGGTAGQRGSNFEPNDPLWVSFARSMAPLAIPTAMFLADFVGAPQALPWRVLDIAAGHGMYGITIAQQNPKAQITAVDWPAVLEVAKQHAVKAGVAERYATRSGSVFETDFGDGYDLVLLTNIFHHFDPETCVKLMKRVYQALKTGGKAVTLDFVPNEDRVTPPREATFSMQMLAATDGGDAYTFSEYQRIFGEAGFPQTTLHPVSFMPQEVLISEKP